MESDKQDSEEAFAKLECSVQQFFRTQIKPHFFGPTNESYLAIVSLCFSFFLSM